MNAGIGVGHGGVMRGVRQGREDLVKFTLRRVRPLDVEFDVASVEHRFDAPLTREAVGGVFAHIGSSTLSAAPVSILAILFRFARGKVPARTFSLFCSPGPRMAANLWTLLASSQISRSPVTSAP
jgi:hypothetical protein